MEQDKRNDKDRRRGRPLAWAIGMILGNEDDVVPADELARLRRDYGANVYRVKP